ncbi:MAG: exopolysaccharide biosynthesis polyprenyl glycosylphosphotransferase [Lachnospiraceae bacterium]|nr:exopolysaccharide biosynthesis polyprenyl glycosylphosphotransferase [Lachnospiraceae bacterium]
MKTMCKKFQNSIILLFEIIIYLGNFAVFFGFLGMENKQLLCLSRTSVVITFSWIVVGILLTVIYGKYDVGVRKSKPIIISLTLMSLLTDGVAYLLLNFMNTNEDNNRSFRLEYFGLLLIIMIIQLLLIIFMTYAGNKFYFWVQDPERCLVITAKETDLSKVKNVIGKFHKRYRIDCVAGYQQENLKEIIRSVDSVFLYEIPVGERTDIVNYCYKHLINVYYNPEVADILEQNSKQVMFDDVTFLVSEFKGMTFEQRICKRLMDIFVSVIALLLSSPILLVSALLIKKQDGGKVFFRQQRATIHGKVFSIYKFRTMKEYVENRSVTKDDDRITPIGKILRKYRLDELPQFINILKGEMSLVGPRPEMLENVDEYTKEMPEFKYRLRMKAGLTGYAQIMGKYNTSSKDKLMLDLMYIENFSILKDIQLLFQTVTVLFQADDSTEAF